MISLQAWLPHRNVQTGSSASIATKKELQVSLHLNELESTHRNIFRDFEQTRVLFLRQLDSVLQSAKLSSVRERESVF